MRSPVTNESVHSLIDPDRSRRSHDGQARLQNLVGSGANDVHCDARAGSRHADQGPDL